MLSSLGPRIQSIWFRLRQGLWFLPTTMTIGAIILAFIMVRVDANLLAGRDIHQWWLFEGGAEGARGVLSAIAGTMITVATTVFSITIVALQLASSQFSPRILRTFTADRGNQVVLGMFIATFAYTLLVLRTVQSATADREVFVPAASVTLAIVLALAAIGSLLFFFHHATRSIQAAVVIDKTANDTMRLIAAESGQEWDNAVDVSEVAERSDLFAVTAQRAGYLTGIDCAALVRTAANYQVVISIDILVGDHLLSPSPLATVPRASLHALEANRQAAFVDEVRQAFHLDMERTLEHDIRLGFRQLSDIALKALSPGVNDPTTAITCIDALGEALLQAQEFRREVTYTPAPEGRGGVRQLQLGFADIVAECLPQLRHYAASDVVVVQHLLGVLRSVAEHVEPPARRVLVEQATDIVREAAATLVLPTDRHSVELAGEWAT